MEPPTSNPSRGVYSRRRWLAAAAFSLNGCSKKAPLILHVGSVDPDSPSGRETAEAIGAVLHGHDIRFETRRLHGDGRFTSFPQAAKSLVEDVEKLQPDVILASGDDVMTHLVAPFLRQGPTPVIFGAVQWSAKAYEVPNRFVTGIVEQPPVEDAIRMVLAGKSDAREIFILAGDSPEVRRNRVFLEPIYWRNKLSTTYGLTPDFARWKRAFRWANEHTDLVYFVSNSGIRDWDAEQAIQHINQWLRVPVFTCDPNLLPYAVAGRVNEPREQGEWMAQQALRVLAGAMPGEIPLAYTSRSLALQNTALAQKMQFTFPQEGK